MLSNYEFSKALIADRQQRLLGEAQHRRLLRAVRRSRRPTTASDGRPGVVVPLRARAPHPTVDEERAAS